MRDVKGDSSEWINDRGFLKERFSWQAGYGAFSYNYRQVDTIIKYIMNQEEHHRRKTFRKEYVEFLEKFNVSYNPRFIIKDIR